MVAASASLESKTLVPERRKRIGDARSDVFAFLEQHKFPFVPSVSNCFMIDVGQPGVNVIMAMRREKVYIGRVWPSWPHHVRVTVGTAEEMARFKAAFLKVMAETPRTASASGA
jgi:histidinol-phosphate/aromatic aminotransferase/cobyric acid decarboxylase-like protein